MVNIELIKNIIESNLISPILTAVFLYALMHQLEMKKETAKLMHPDYNHMLNSLYDYSQSLKNFMEKRKSYKEKYEECFDPLNEDQISEREQSLDKQDELMKNMDKNYNNIQDFLDKLKRVASPKIRKFVYKNIDNFKTYGMMENNSFDKLIFLIRCEMGLIKFTNKIAYHFLDKIIILFGFVWKILISIGVKIIKIRKKLEI